MEKPKILTIGNTCPNCGSSQFSISEISIYESDWPNNVLGVSDCRSCQRDFLVKFAPEIEKNVTHALERNKIEPEIIACVIQVLFREGEKPKKLSEGD